MAVKIGHASISENKTIRGNAGDQTGKEVCVRDWYKRDEGWVLLRCKDEKMRPYIAEAMEKACANDDIGYDQGENETLWNNVKDKGFDPSKTTKKVETDCSRLVRLCCQYACEKVKNGKTIPTFYTGTQASKLVGTGLFEKLTASKYVNQDAYLIRGDILVTKTKGHTVVVLTNGSKAGKATEPEKNTAPADTETVALEKGMYNNAAVKVMQQNLITLGYLANGEDDGDFGPKTEKALKEFQKAAGIAVDGSYGPESRAAMEKALKRKVKIVNGNCNVRPDPSTNGKPLGVAKRGETYDYLGSKSENGWHLIDFKGKQGWVSGKYSKLEE